MTIPALRLTLFTVSAGRNWSGVRARPLPPLRQAALRASSPRTPTLRGCLSKWRT